MAQTESSKRPLDAQIDRFKQAAHAVESDEDEHPVKPSLRKVAKPKPEPEKRD